MRSILCVVAMMTASHAAPAPQPFLAKLTPRDFCDVRPREPACTAEMRKIWRDFLAGPHATSFHRTATPRLVAGTQVSRQGWAFVLVFPVAPAPAIRSHLTVELGGVTVSANDLFRRYV